MCDALFIFAVIVFEITVVDPSFCNYFQKFSIILVHFFCDLTQIYYLGFGRDMHMNHSFFILGVIVFEKYHMFDILLLSEYNPFSSTLWKFL